MCSPGARVGPRAAPEGCGGAAGGRWALFGSERPASSRWGFAQLLLKEFGRLCGWGGLCGLGRGRVCDSSFPWVWVRLMSCEGQAGQVSCSALSPRHKLMAC